jgi:hypothetical protein
VYVGGVWIGGVLQLVVRLRCLTGFAAQYPPWPGQHAGARRDPARNIAKLMVPAYWASVWRKFLC